MAEKYHITCFIFLNFECRKCTLKNAEGKVVKMYVSYISNQHGTHRNERKNLKGNVYVWAVSLESQVEHHLSDA